MTNRLISHIAFVASAIALASPPGLAAPPLPRLGADLAQTSVSGFSSGAYMAGQFAVAYSSIVRGAGMVAGGPYYCTGEPEADPPLRNALTRCMNPAFAQTPPPDAASLWSRTRQFAADGLIDDVANLARQRIFLFNGRQDQVLTTEVSDQARRFYGLAGTRAITYVNDTRAGHGMVTNRPGDNDCGASYRPFFNNCGIPLARDILSAIYGQMRAASARLRGRLLQFDQRDYVPQAGSGLADSGYLFVPRACARGGCRVHVAFHGCWQSAQTVGDHFYRWAGYNETADANRIIVLYPQVTASTAPFNPAGCWDYWGYTNPAYYTRSGMQLSAVRAMLARLAE
ncbi:MAG TPA: poly(3-hydroxybutyrate) depolymerase [Telluria sp.]|nr:poly(3-hydroxybutyrate) depolymerase [Telluria sp.]